MTNGLTTTLCLAPLLGAAVGTGLAPLLLHWTGTPYFLAPVLPAGAAVVVITIWQMRGFFDSRADVANSVDTRAGVADSVANNSGSPSIINDTLGYVSSAVSTPGSGPCTPRIDDVVCFSHMDDDEEEPTEHELHEQLEELSLVKGN